jgi:hypothetical protein
LTGLLYPVGKQTDQVFLLVLQSLAFIEPNSTAPNGQKNLSYENGKNRGILKKLTVK